MGEQDSRQAPMPDLYRDPFRDGCRCGDAQPGSLSCGSVLQIHMVEGLPWEQAGLAVRARFVPVRHGLLTDHCGERGMSGSGVFNHCGFHG